MQTHEFSFSGDELLGATIDFDQLSKDEVYKVLRLMEPFDGKMKVLTRNNKSKSLGNLDQCDKSPETVGGVQIISSQMGLKPKFLFGFPVIQMALILVALTVYNVQLRAVFCITLIIMEINLKISYLDRNADNVVVANHQAVVYIFRC